MRKLHGRVKEIAGAFPVSDQKVSTLEKLEEIHRRSNLMHARMYEVVDQAENPEEREVLAHEACQAIWQHAGEKCLGYHPNRGIVIDDWMIA
jgi:hypothetical protein